MAAQKYGPPLVGWALQISEVGHYKRDSFWMRQEARACHSQAH